MYEFDFWYAYFDSLFLKQITAPHKTFLQTLLLNELLKLNFLQCKKLPSISKCFSQFQKFLLSQDTWVQSQCQEDHLKQIQININKLILMINVQKRYGRQYWHSKRRIQASVCHFFSLFNFFVYSLIPSDLQNIQKCQTNNKLCTSIKKLQNLVNQILPQIKQIIQFLHDQLFSQQRKMTILFLKEVRQVILNLPKISKKKIKINFQLNRYLYLVIPIEISNTHYKFKAKRKKTFTIDPTVQNKYNSQVYINQQHRKSHNTLRLQKSINSQHINKNHKSVKDQFRLINKNVNKKVNQNNFIIEQSLIEHENTIPNLFQFSQKVRKYSIHINSKKVTKATFDTRQTFQNTEKQRKHSQYAKIIEKGRKASEYAKTTQSLSKQKDLGRSLSIAKNRIALNQGQATTRSKKSSFHKIHKKIQIQNSQKLRHPNKTSPVKQNIKKSLNLIHLSHNRFHRTSQSYCSSRKVNFDQGKTKGWGIIQQQLIKKVIIKKISSLINNQYSDIQE